MHPDYFLGLDLGQANNYSALAVLERTESIVEIPHPDKPAGKRSSWHFGCRALKRWPLGTAYTTIVAELGEMVRRPPLVKSKLVVDATGLGRPVTDMLRKAQLPVDLIPVTITSGTKENRHNGYYHVPKFILISTLQVLLQQRRLQFAQEMPETPTIVAELQNYRVKITESAHETFEGRENDDLLLAAALGCWHGERIPKVEPFRFQTIGLPRIPMIR